MRGLFFNSPTISEKNDGYRHLTANCDISKLKARIKNTDRHKRAHPREGSGMDSCGVTRPNPFCWAMDPTVTQSERMQIATLFFWIWKGMFFLYCRL